MNCILSGTFNILLVITVLFSNHLIAQIAQTIVEKKILLEKTTVDTVRINLLGDLAFDYLNIDIDSASRFADLLIAEGRRTKHKKYYADALSVYGTVQRYLGNIDSALIYSEQCYAIRAEIKDSVGMFKILGNIGNTYNHLLGDFETSLTYYAKSLQIQKNLRDEIAMGVTYFNMSSVYIAQGKFLQAQQFLQMSADIAEKYNDLMTLGKIYMSMGDLFVTIGQTEKGINYLELSLNNRRESGDSLGVANVLNTLAAAYDSQSDYETSYQYALSAVRLREELSDSIGLYIGCGNLAILLLRMEKYEEAMAMAERSLLICENLNYEPGISSASTIIGEIYLALENPSKAAKYCERSYAIISNYDALEDLRDVCECLYLAYDALNEPVKALRFLKEHVALKDSLIAQNKIAEVIQAQMKYEFEKTLLADSLIRESEEKIKGLFIQEKRREYDNKISYQNVVIVSVFVIFSVILITSLIFFRVNKSRQIAKARQKLIEMELMALRAQMNPHFIFNCLSSIQNCIDKHEYDLADKYLTKFSKLLRLVLTTSRKPFISINDEIEYLGLYIDLENLRQNNKFTYRINVADDIDKTEVELPVMLIQPYVENAIKHGLALKEKDGLLEIEFRKNEPELIISIKDNGIGRERAQTFKKSDLRRKEHTSLGLLITEERLNLLYNNGASEKTISIFDRYDESGNPVGTEVILVIPLEIESELNE